MFHYGRNIWISDTLSPGGVRHGFSTREGGVSTLSHTASMNVAFLRGDSDETVRENIRLLCGYAGVSENVVCTPQIHSTEVRVVSPENGGEGITRDVPYPCDGFVTDKAGITLLVRVADCIPILLCAKAADGRRVIGAVHAGWRGAAGGIAAVCVQKMKALGAGDIYAAIGAGIHSCCYRVGEDMRDEVRRLCGEEVTARCITERDGALYADIVGINEEYLRGAGVRHIDVCPECTACNPRLYHSHRATGGLRGTMGAVIGITE